MCNLNIFLALNTKSTYILKLIKIRHTRCVYTNRTVLRMLLTKRKLIYLTYTTAINIIVKIPDDMKIN